MSRTGTWVGALGWVPVRGDKVTFPYLDTHRTYLIEEVGEGHVILSCKEWEAGERSTITYRDAADWKMARWEGDFVLTWDEN